MALSVFDLFSVGIGPSSSHTVGPMHAANKFADLTSVKDLFRVKIDLYGSLALTGKGHHTDQAIYLGLEGYRPDTVDPDLSVERIKKIRSDNNLLFSGEKMIPFDPVKDLIFHKDKQLPFHPNGMRFTAYNKVDHILTTKTYYSVGGGFIVDHEEIKPTDHLGDKTHRLKLYFDSANQLLQICRDHNMTIEQVMLQNELTWRNENEVKDNLRVIWRAMCDCIERGCRHEGVLPGGLNVKRRAPIIYKRLKEEKTNPNELLKWISLWALAVNEENAAGGRIVTAPTNGSAGVIPAVLKYYFHFHENSNEDGIFRFLLTAGAVGILYKKGASISGAEMGCMGEVGVACSMAAAGLTAALGGTVDQIENAAEIGMEHNLGLTCDPIKGLVQIPCIERNTMGAIKAINAQVLAMQGDGTHYVSLDQVIATMRQTGKDMQTIYKETSLGGLAVNVPEC